MIHGWIQIQSARSYSPQHCTHGWARTLYRSAIMQMVRLQTYSEKWYGECRSCRMFTTNLSCDLSPSLKRLFPTFDPPRTYRVITASGRSRRTPTNQAESSISPFTLLRSFQDPPKLLDSQFLLLARSFQSTGETGETGETCETGETGETFKH